MQTKTFIRKSIKDKFSLFSSVKKEQESTDIMNKICEHQKIKTCQKIAIYISQSDELNTGEIIKQLLKMWKKIYVPIIKDKDLFFSEIQKDSSFHKSVLGIYEPDSSEIYDGEINVFLVPWRAFTLDGRRIWRGNGYYDRFFSQEKYKKSYKIGLCYSFQIVSNFLEDVWDIGMDEIIY
jgi:5-formyltetrahydrofolate cyclo-ligase